MRRTCPVGTQSPRKKCPMEEDCECWVPEKNRQWVLLEHRGGSGRLPQDLGNRKESREGCMSAGWEEWCEFPWWLAQTVLGIPGPLLQLDCGALNATTHSGRFPVAHRLHFLVGGDASHSGAFVTGVGRCIVKKADWLIYLIKKLWLNAYNKIHHFNHLSIWFCGIQLSQFCGSNFAIYPQTFSSSQTEALPIKSSPGNCSSTSCLWLSLL
jgi:hypothetical protein